MKTFTLRLTDEEAEALERMTFIENEVRPGGQSKNKFIEELIASEYAKYERYAVLNNKIKFITPAFGFASVLYEEAETYCRENAEALAAIDYSISKLSENPKSEDSDEEQAALNEMRESLIKYMKRKGEIE